ncbi:sigma 54-interacting transcriptional regulator [Burkholderia sp. Cy-637]|uniref:sigma 54-interacting transcriptional regulator n=1 Tax=Burkholderia sp. Cy-637 TaxID=2608327 RepID=UPI0014211DD0|nr:sigma 54-interacting transcriptional regulator [Burkholderia sp. Cy-637]
MYVLLDGKAAKPVDGMTPVMFVAYGSAEVDGPESVPWPAESTHSASPISYLVNRARWNAWSVAAKHVLRRHGAESSWEQWLDAGPQWFAQLDPGQFDRPNAATHGDQGDALIARELKHVARQIVERKTAFVFPAKWPDNLAKAATELVRLMIRELCAYLREAPVEPELPWTFLSMNTDSGGRDPLGEFIRALHSEMLTDTSGVDVVAWSQKGGAILLSGPTGSGKSYAARLLAADTKYRSRLVEVNLAAVVDEQLESRMRGYKAGTFTGGLKEGRAGWFEEADGGVLFLDEFQSVSLASQVQLLDLLNAVSNDIQIARTGADHERSRFNVKVILAINEDIDTLLREKRLRKDIYYRIRLVEAFPSLKERLNRDMGHRYLRGLLASYRWKSLRTIEQLCRLEGGWRDMVPTFFPVFSLDALFELASQEWEGNFRELERVAFDLFYGCDYQQLSTRIDRARVENVVNSSHVPGNPAGNAADGMTEVERRKLNDIQQALRESRFVIATALKNQPYFRSRPPLKRYLRDHVEKLAADIRGDSRMTRFLGLLEHRT